LIASSRSQRAIVGAEASQTPRSTTSRWMSAHERRESGAPSDAGSQATAFTSATCSGGKTARATAPRSVIETVEALLEEASSPAPDDLRRRVEPGRDLDVRQPVGGVEDKLRPLDHLVRQRVTGRPPLELDPLLGRQNDLMRALPRHRRQDSPQGT